MPGYTPGTWSCTGGVVTGTTVVVPNGGVVACQITNTAVAPTLTLVKVVVNDDGGTATGVGVDADRDGSDDDLGSDG